ncbi:MAG: hypothetical protein AAFN93_11815 [Bacteroidota bacterium]
MNILPLKIKRVLAVTSLTIFILTSGLSQQRGDNSFNPEIKNPLYPYGTGPMIYIDEAHNNFHTMEGRFKAFATVLENDGYRMAMSKANLSKGSLDNIDFLVISNAIHKDNLQEWSLPTPSAFEETEIESLNEWVREGGALFLIADHMPFPGAASDLAASFGFKFYNGFAIKKKKTKDLFTIENGGLVESKLTKAREIDDNVTSIQSFTGQCFEAPSSATPILVFNNQYENLMPRTAWKFDEDTHRMSAEGLLQGAYLEYGKGRLVVFGEAAMFTAQMSGGRKFGLSAPNASQNVQLLLNILHWLDRTID